MDLLGGSEGQGLTLPSNSLLQISDIRVGQHLQYGHHKHDQTSGTKRGDYAVLYNVYHLVAKLMVKKVDSAKKQSYA